MESKKVESNAELTPFEKEFKVQLNLPAAYFSVFNKYQFSLIKSTHIH